MKRLSVGLSNCDLVLTTGGVSMGEKDFLKAILTQDFGATVHFGRVDMKPGSVYFQYLHSQPICCCYL